MRVNGLLIGLIVSMVLNVFLIGAGAGVFALALRMAHASAVQRPGAFVRAARDLPPAAKLSLRRSIRQAWLEVRPGVQESRALKVAAWGALADPAPDVATIKLKLAQSRQLDLQARTRVEEAVVDAALGLPGPDRAAFADGLRRVLGPAPTAASGQPPPRNQGAAPKP